jgi:hypothetical protein
LFNDRAINKPISSLGFPGLIPSYGLIPSEIIEVGTVCDSDICNEWVYILANAAE